MGLTFKQEEKALNLLKEKIKKHENPFVANSLGKNSIVVSHLVRRIDDKIPNLITITGVNHPTIYPVLKHYEDQGVKFIKAKPGKDVFPEKYKTERKKEEYFETVKKLKNGKERITFWDIVREFGWPIGARNTSSNEAVNKCCDFLKKDPMAKVAEKNKFDLEINGVTAYESWTRYTRLKGYGLYKFVKSRGKEGRYVLMPTGWWHADDVWDYIEKYDLKYPNVYDEEFDDFTKRGKKEKTKGVWMDRKCIRLGCWPCPLTLKYTNKVMKQLRLFHPKMWKTVMKKGLAKEIARIKLGYGTEGGNQGELWNGYFDDDTQQQWLERRPCFFDKI